MQNTNSIVVSPQTESPVSLGTVLIQLKLIQDEASKNLAADFLSEVKRDVPKQTRKRAAGRPSKLPSREAIMKQIGRGNVITSSLAKTFGVCDNVFIRYADSHNVGYVTYRGLGRHYLTDAQYYGDETTVLSSEASYSETPNI